MDNFSQGGAYVNNLFCGEIRQETVLDRATLYHYPHSTEVAGFATVYWGDDRYYGNLFIGKDELDFESSGTSTFNG